MYGQFFEISIGNRDVETIADVTHAVHVHFTVSDVFAFRGVAHAITFNGMGQRLRRFAFSFLRFSVPRKLRIVTTTVSAQICSSVQSATSAAVSGYLPKKCSRT